MSVSGFGPLGEANNFRLQPEVPPAIITIVPGTVVAEFLLRAALRGLYTARDEGQLEPQTITDVTQELLGTTLTTRDNTRSGKSGELPVSPVVAALMARGLNCIIDDGSAHPDERTQALNILKEISNSPAV
jgi:hypothetical protein